MQKRTTGIVLAFLLTACGGSMATLPAGPKPAWLDAPEGKYPSQDFITGVGMFPVEGGDLEAAQKGVDAQARVELTKKLEVSVSSEFSAYQAEFQKDGKNTSVQAVEDLTRETVQGFDLQGVEIKHRWLDEASGVAYAIAVWPKARAEAVLKAKLSEADTAGRKAMAEGDKALDGRPGTALRQYLSALATLESAQKQAVLLRAVTGKAADVPDASPARGKLDALLEKVDVKAEEGDGQRVKPGKAAPRPLSVKATVGGAPLAGLPLRFVLPGGEVDEAAETDAQGVAAVRASNVGAMASGEAKVTAKVDWPKLAGAGDSPPAWVAGLRPFETAFRLVSSSLATTRVLVKIIERIEEAEGMDVGAVQSSVTNSFVSAGFNVKDGAALVDRIPAAQLLTLDPQAFKKQAHDLADVVVVGEAVSAHSSMLSAKRNVMVHRARLNLRVVDLGSGKVLASLSKEEKGRPAKGDAKAGKKALEALAAKIDGGLPTQVKSELGF